MKEIYKKPIFYYVLIPALISLWPIWLLVFGVPGVKDNLEKSVNDYVEAQKLISQILGELDPQRLDYAKNKKTGEAFDFITAIDQVTKLVRITPTGYRLSTSPIRKIKGGQTNQDASMTIEKINIEKFTKFLSVMHMRWSNLQCSNVTLSKIKGEKDAWKADVRFIYYQ
ncbi:MAG: hypothetical protein A2Y10_02100 [Planctomycetes bacterium GWF2_41_51]|nr:MAG: hypothetical protein A2Y10_02100 [Planctomycetes bacterium GWF2_41_51]HBG28328.1 hypothetical protein [Phycisphaerales bacterium]